MVDVSGFEKQALSSAVHHCVILCLLAVLHCSVNEDRPSRIRSITSQNQREVTAIGFTWVQPEARGMLIY